MIIRYQGRMQHFSGGAQFFGFWVYMPRSSMSRAVAKGGLGECSFKKIFKNGAISCVLRAIFNHFHDKKSSEKTRNKQVFFR